MTGALLSAALAVLLWPDRRAVRRARLATLAGRGRGAHRGRRALPVAPAAGVVAAAVGGSLSTPLVAALAGVVAFLGARAWVAGRRGDRSEGQLLALTEGLGALAADLRSGRSLEAATGDGGGRLRRRRLRASARPRAALPAIRPCR